MTDTTERTTEEPTTDKDRVVVRLTKEQAKQAAAISHGAAPDRDGRPSLAQVRLRIDSDRFEVLTTDSYILAAREFAITEYGPKDIPNTVAVRRSDYGDDIGNQCESTINAVEFREAMTSAAKTSSEVTIDIREDWVTVRAGGMAIEMRGNAHSFPGIDKIESDNAAGSGSWNGKLPAFNPRLIAKLVKTTGYTLAKVPAMSWEVTDKQAASSTPEQLPSVFTLPGDAGWRGLLMPVRR